MRVAVLALTALLPLAATVAPLAAAEIETTSLARRRTPGGLRRTSGPAQ